MTLRPTDQWSRMIEDEATQLAAGTLAPEMAISTAQYPYSLREDTDAALDDFELQLLELVEPSDDEVMAVVKAVAMDLNEVSRRHAQPFDARDSDQLCFYIDAALTSAGIDVRALAARRNLTRLEITDEWNEW